MRWFVLYNAADGDNWADNRNWLSDRPIGEWAGVTTNESGRVTKLDLAENRLSGAHPIRTGQPHQSASTGPLEQPAERFNPIGVGEPAESGSAVALEQPVERLHTPRSAGCDEECFFRA